MSNGSMSGDRSDFGNRNSKSHPCVGGHLHLGQGHSTGLNEMICSRGLGEGPERAKETSIPGSCAGSGHGTAKPNSLNPRGVCEEQSPAQKWGERGGTRLVNFLNYRWIRGCLETVFIT